MKPITPGRPPIITWDAIENYKQLMNKVGQVQQASVKEADLSTFVKNVYRYYRSAEQICNLEYVIVNSRSRDLLERLFLKWENKLDERHYNA